jgi:hypothetical protein
MPRVSVVENVSIFGVIPFKSNVVQIGSTGNFEEKWIAKVELVQ